MNKKIRCPWAYSHPLYLRYHDQEWGQATFDSRKLFELLCLEGQQAGLSWLLILKKRPYYQRLFHNFQPEKIISLSDAEKNALLKEAGIIRNEKKINAIIQNAHAYLNVEKHLTFADFIWQTVDYQPVIHHLKSSDDMPCANNLSHLLAKKLKKEGFVFIGPVICYSFMQAAGLINDHVTECFLHPDATELESPDTLLAK